MKIRIEIGAQSAVIEDGAIVYKQWFIGNGWANWLTINIDQVNDTLVSIAEDVCVKEKIRSKRQLGDKPSKVSVTTKADD